jgi:hypothetical protein
MPALREKGHTVRATMSVRELTKAGTSLNLEIYARGEKLGEVLIGRGTLYWTGSRRQSSKRISWTKFAELMDARPG